MRGRIKKSGLVRFTTVPIHTFSYYRKLVFLYLFFWYFFVREFISQSSATVFLMVCQLPTVRYSPRYRIHWIYEFICACNLIMRDSWIDEVHMSASWLCSLFLSHLLSLGSSDRSHNAPTFVSVSMLVDESPYLMTLGHALQAMSHTSVSWIPDWFVFNDVLLIYP